MHCKCPAACDRGIRCCASFSFRPHRREDTRGLRVLGRMLTGEAGSCSPCTLYISIGRAALLRPERRLAEKEVAAAECLTSAGTGSVAERACFSACRRHHSEDSVTTGPLLLMLAPASPGPPSQGVLFFS